jgi:nitroreductase
MNNIDILEGEIRNRRAVYPAMYKDETISKEELLEIIDNARWAPTHRLTQPWRFIVFQSESLVKLSEYLGEYYQKNTPEESFSEIKFNKTIGKPLKSGCVLAIILHRDPEEKVPEWEEVASLGMAVQNIWLSCSARGIGAYWSSPQSAIMANDFLNLAENEKCLGLFYMGWRKTNPPAPERKPMEDIVSYF